MEWLENLKIRFQVWRFERRAIEMDIVRSCGHIEHGEVLPEWIEPRRNSPCLECVFFSSMSESKYWRQNK